MESIRTSGDYSLNKAVNGMYNVTDQELDTSLTATARMKVSLWLGTETAEELMEMKDEDFKVGCEEILNF